MGHPFIVEQIQSLSDDKVASLWYTVDKHCLLLESVRRLIAN